MKQTDTNKFVKAQEDCYADVVNLYPDSKGHIAILIGHKSFAGMVYQLKRINKRCIKNNWSSDFTIRLPLKWK